MLPAGFVHTPPTVFALVPPLHRRLATAFASALERFAQDWRRRTQDRAARRLAEAQQASLADLDTHTLRDLGLGDWAATRRSSNVWMRWF